MILFSTLMKRRGPVIGDVANLKRYSMAHHFTSTKKGQLKVQEMAFVLVALMVFFALIALLYLSVRGSFLEQRTAAASDERALEAVRRIAGTPELNWQECLGCIDLDKVFVLKERISKNASFARLWEYDYLVVENIYPAASGGECTPASYPACNRTTILNIENYGVAQSTFVTLCRWDQQEQKICTLGKLYVSDKGRERAS